MFRDAMATDLLWNRLTKRWKDGGLTIRAGVGEHEISTFERKYGVVLPPAVRQYFETVDGTGDDMEGDYYYTFWPLSAVKPVEDHLSDANGVIYSNRYSYPQCYVFADHLLNSWDYAVKLTLDPNQPAPVFRVNGATSPPDQVSPSFREFMTQYLADPKSIL